MKNVKKTVELDFQLYEVTFQDLENITKGKIPSVIDMSNHRDVKDGLHLDEDGNIIDVSVAVYERISLRPGNAIERLKIDAKKALEENGTTQLLWDWDSYDDPDRIQPLDPPKI